MMRLAKSVISCLSSQESLADKRLERLEVDAFGTRFFTAGCKSQL
jgi:hypothetical protein